MKRRSWGVVPFATLAAVFWGVIALPAAAQSSSQAAGFELPRAPLELDPVLGVEVHFSAVFPVARQTLCPDGADCVFGGGAGIGTRIEHRAPDGLVLAAGYDAWFLDSDGVYELGVMQQISGIVRYLFLDRTLLHPFVAGGIGALVFGDTLRVATVGASVEIAAGAEIELTESISLVVSAPWRLFTTTSFKTPRDRVERATEFGVNAAFGLQIGVLLLETPGQW